MKLPDRKDVPRELPHVPSEFTGKLIALLSEYSITRSELMRTCVSCMNWDDTNELCKLYNARPPAPIIANGCERYDDLPF